MKRGEKAFFIMSSKKIVLLLLEPRGTPGISLLLRRSHRYRGHYSIPPLNVWHLSALRMNLWKPRTNCVRLYCAPFYWQRTRLIKEKVLGTRQIFNKVSCRNRGHPSYSPWMKLSPRYIGIKEKVVRNSVIGSQSQDYM